MKHLILGSSGQIGRHLVNYLKLVRDQEVIEFDIENNLSQDLRRYGNVALKDSIKKCDIVHFLAYDVGGAKYLEAYQDTFDFINNNMLIMSNVFELIKKYNKPVLFASSQMSELNHSSYGMLKRLGEQMTKDVGGVNVRFWNVFGWEPNSEKSHVITDFIKMAKEDGEIKMRTDGTESRQFLYADDCCEALWVLSRSYDQLWNHESYDISSGKWTTILEVAKLIQKISDCKITVGTNKDKTQQNAMNEPNLNINQWWQPNYSLFEGIKEIWNISKE